MSFPWILSLMVGFLSLSQEILWVRLIGFVQGGAPVAFAFVLTLYLVGIAIGAAIGKVFCNRSHNLYAIAAYVLLLAAATDPLPVFLGPLIAYHGGPVTLLHVVPPVIAIVLTAAIKSILFPIAHHLGSNQSGPRVGSSVSNIYFGNIIGSTLGPIVTGYFLLDTLSVDACFRLVAVVSLFMAVLCAAHAGWTRRLTVSVGTVASVVVGLAFAQSSFVRSAGERWVDWGPNHQPINGKMHYVIENRHGIIHTNALAGRDDDIVYGGNIYDGRINFDLRNDTNGIDRVYLLAALHPNPKRILVIGLSGGGWTQALLTFPDVELVDVAEINRGYIELVNRYDAVRPLLADPRVRIHIDDGRRWLKRNPDTRYDLIVINTTFHWRAYATNLLSVDFMHELQTHLRPGGILALNTTKSLDVMKTVAAAYPHAYRYQGFVYAAMHDFRAVPAAVRERLRRLRREREPLLSDVDFADKGVGARLANVVLEPVGDLLARYNVEAGIITDANMLTEYRHGKRVGIPLLELFLPERQNMLFSDR